MDDDAPANSGQVRISYNGFLSSHVYRWPIVKAGYNQPSVELVLRHRDDGEIFLAFEEDWDNAFDD